MANDNEPIVTTPDGRPIPPQAPSPEVPSVPAAPAQGAPSQGAEPVVTNPNGEPIATIQDNGDSFNAGDTWQQSLTRAMTGDKNTPLYKVPAASVGEFAKGLGKGALSTVSGVSNLIHGGLNLIDSDTAEKWLPSEGINAEEQMATPTNVAQRAGFTTEGLLEFIMGDEALKGMSLSRKLDAASKIYQTLEKSPKLMALLRAGAKSKMLTMGGETALRNAIVAAAQTVAHGGSAKEALESLAIGGTIGLVGGGTAGAIQSAGQRVREGVEAQRVLSEEAANAPTSEEIRENMSKTLKEGEQQMHSDYQKGVKSLSNRLQGATHPMDNSPARTAAQDVLEDHAGGPPEHPFETKARVSATDKLDKPVKEILQDIAKNEYGAPSGDILDTFAGHEQDPDAERLVRVNKYGDKTDLGIGTDPANIALKKGEGLFGVKANGDWTWLGGDSEPFTNPAAEGEKAVPGDKLGEKLGGEFRAKTLSAPPANVDNLIGLRQKLATLARNYDIGDMNSRALYRVMHGIDDTIEKLAEQSGDPEVAGDYKQLRADYREQVNAFNDPAIQKLMSGTKDEAADFFIKGTRKAETYDNLVKAVGVDKTKQFGLEVYKHLLAMSETPNGDFSADRFLALMKKIPDEVQNKLFDIRVLPKNFQGDRNLTEVLLNNAKTAKSMGYLTRALGAAGMTVLPHSLLYMLGAAWIAGGINKTAQVLNDVANSPWVWKGLGMVGDTAVGAGKFIERTAPAGGYAGEKAVTGQSQSSDDSGIQNINVPTPEPGQSSAPTDINSGRWVDAFRSPDGQFDADKMADFITQFEGSQEGRNNPGAMKATTDDRARSLGADLNPPRDAKGFLRFSSPDKGRDALKDMLTRFANDPKMQQLTPLEFINGKDGVYPGYAPNAAPENKNHPAESYAQSMLQFAKQNQGGEQESADSGIRQYDPSAGVIR